MSVQGRFVKKDQEHSARCLNINKNGTKTDEMKGSCLFNHFFFFLLSPKDGG